MSALGGALEQAIWLIPVSRNWKTVAMSAETFRRTADGQDTPPPGEQPHPRQKSTQPPLFALQFAHGL